MRHYTEHEKKIMRRLNLREQLRRDLLSDPRVQDDDDDE